MSEPPPVPLRNSAERIFGSSRALANRAGVRISHRLPLTPMLRRYVDQPSRAPIESPGSRSSAKVSQVS
jgi:hypothetical protein